VDGVDNRGHQENRCPLACGWPRCDAVETWGQVVDTRGNLVEPSTLAMQRSTPPRHLSTPRLQLSTASGRLSTGRAFCGHGGAAAGCPAQVQRAGSASARRAESLNCSED